MEREDIEAMLPEHYKWLSGCGKRLKLNGKNLNGIDLSELDLRLVDFSDSRLMGANFRYANLSRAYFGNANLTDANFYGANLYGANLYEANLTNTVLNSAFLTGARLERALLHEALYDDKTAFLAMQCPSDGAFVAWKKASGYIVKLEIPEDALRSSSTTRKCRADKAKVLGIYNDEKILLEVQEVFSNWDKRFAYKVGEMVYADWFDENRWEECAPGIHFFITFDEAKNY